MNQYRVTMTDKTTQDVVCDTFGQMGALVLFFDRAEQDDVKLAINAEQVAQVEKLNQNEKGEVN